MHPTTLDQAIFELNSRRNDYTYCSISVQADGQPAKSLLTQADYEEERVRDIVGSAFQYYPGQRVVLNVYDKNGTGKKLNTSYLLINPDTNMGGITPSYHQPQPQGSTSQQPDMGLGAMANYLLNEKALQIADLKQEIVDKRDHIKTLEATIREEQQKREKAEFELRHKDKEHELSIRAKELEGSNSLGGVLSNTLNDPTIQQMLLGAVLSKYTGAPMLPAAQIAGAPEPPATHADPAAQEAITGMVNWLGSAPTDIVVDFYTIMTLVATGKADLKTLIAPYR